jgi:two-component system, OmpR family, response regulator RpaA
MIRIYIVEDGRDLAWVLEESFQLEGYDVVTASNGLEALQRMRRQPPDLVILDVNMPVMDGFALAQRMRADPLLKWLPIIFLTVHSDFPSKLQGFRNGGDDYIVKPFDLTELQLRVQAVLRRCNIKDHGDRDIVAAPGFTLNLATRQATVHGHPIRLTEIESDLLRYFLSHVAIPISAQQLLTEVLDFPPGTGDLSTIRSHMRNLRQKIESDPDHPVHLCTAKPRGYCFQPAT